MKKLLPKSSMNTKKARFYHICKIHMPKAFIASNFLHLTYLLETPVELCLNLVWIYMLQVHQLLLEEDYSLMSQVYLQEEYDHSSQQTPAVEDYSLMIQGYLQEEYDYSFQQTPPLDSYNPHTKKGQLIEMSRKRKRKNVFYNRRIV